jgi:hypothetical protein
MQKISEINYLLVEYDFVNFCTNTICKHNIQKIFSNVNYGFDKNFKSNVSINLNDYTLPDNKLYEVYSFEPIVYVSGGYTGDFLNSLYVVYENYCLTGRKGIIYLTTKTHDFRLSLEITHRDTYDVIMKQFYIKEYKIHKGEKYDEDLSKWRHSKLLWKDSWHNIFKNVYNVNWGVNKWLNLPVDSRWSDKILVSTNLQRQSKTLDYRQVYNKYGKDMIYYSQDKKCYEEFKKRFNLDIEYYCPSTFYELCVGINSCKLFCGNLSTPLVVAIACNKYFMIEFANSPDDIHNCDYISLGKNEIRDINDFNV